MISYSQNFEDIILNKVFSGQNDGFYIDVGAYDPVIDSVTKHFYDKGWKGINIDPLSKVIDEFNKIRLRDINLLCAISNTSGICTFYENTKYPGLSTTTSQYIQNSDAEYIIKHDVQSKTLSQVIEKYVKDEINFLKVDAEGAEKKVLEGLNLKKNRPIVILLEATKPQTPIENYTDWEYLLFENNYKFVYFDGLNRFYLRGDRLDLESKFVPPNVFDEFELHHHIKLQSDLEKRTQEYIQANEGLHTVTAEKLLLEDELEGIKSSFLYKIYKALKTFFKK